MDLSLVGGLSAFIVVPSSLRKEGREEDPYFGIKIPLIDADYDSSPFRGHNQREEIESGSGRTKAIGLHTLPIDIYRTYLMTLIY